MRRLLILALMVGCGGKSGGGGGPSEEVPPAEEQAGKAYHSMLVQDAGVLPACDAPAEGWLVYVLAETSFKVCHGGTWTAVDIKGPKGDKGDPAEVSPGDPAPAVKQKLLVDAKDQIIGFVKDGEKLVTFAGGTFKASLTDALDGFSKLGDYQSCYFNGNCSGECFLTSNKVPGFGTAAKIFLPDAGANPISQSKSLRTDNDLTSCVSVPPSFAPPDGHYYPTIAKEFTPPFRLIDQ